MSDMDLGDDFGGIDLDRYLDSHVNDLQAFPLPSQDHDDDGDNAMLHVASMRPISQAIVASAASVRPSGEFYPQQQQRQQPLQQQKQQQQQQQQQQMQQDSALKYQFEDSKRGVRPQQQHAQQHNASSSGGGGGSGGFSFSSLGKSDFQLAADADPFQSLFNQKAQQPKTFTTASFASLAAASAAAVPERPAMHHIRQFEADQREKQTPKIAGSDLAKLLSGGTDFAADKFSWSSVGGLPKGDQAHSLMGKSVPLSRVQVEQGNGNGNDGFSFASMFSKDHKQQEKQQLQQPQQQQPRQQQSFTFGSLPPKQESKNNGSSFMDSFMFSAPTTLAGDSSLGNNKPYDMEEALAKMTLGRGGGIQGTSGGGVGGGGAYGTAVAAAAAAGKRKGKHVLNAYELEALRKKEELYRRSIREPQTMFQPPDAELEGLQLLKPYSLYKHQRVGALFVANQEMRFAQEYAGRPPHQRPSKPLMDGVLLHAEMGLGKTLMTRSVCHVDHVRAAKAARIKVPHLWVVPLTLVPVWLDDVEKFSGASCRVLVLHVGSVATTKKYNFATFTRLTKDTIGMVQLEDICGFDAVLTTYDFIANAARVCKVTEHYKVSNAEINPVEMAPDTPTGDKVWYAKVKQQNDDFVRKSKTMQGKELALAQRLNLARLLFGIHWRRVVADEGQLFTNAKKHLFRSMMALKSHKKLVCTGTPIRNNKLDIYALVRFLGYHGITRTRDWTEESFQELGLDKWKLSMNYVDAGIVLPQRHMEVRKYKFSPQEEKCYELIKGLMDKTLSDYQAGRVKFTNVLSMALRLRQACIGSYLIGGPTAEQQLFPNKKKRVKKPKGQGAKGKTKLSTKPTAEQEAEEKRQEDAEFRRLVGLPEQPSLTPSAMSSQEEQVKRPDLTAGAAGLKPTAETKKESVFGEFGDTSDASEKKTQELKAMNRWIEDRWGTAGVGSSKLNEIKDWLQTVILPKKKKLIVFSSFVTSLLLVKDMLTQNGIGSVMLHGQVKPEEREILVNQFKVDPNIQVILLPYKVGAAGLNLTVANYVIHMDPWWSAAQHLQAGARAWRIGQTEEVFERYLVAEGSIEEKIVAIAHAKIKLSNKILCLAVDEDDDDADGAMFGGGGGGDGLDNDDAADRGENQDDDDDSGYNTSSTTDGDDDDDDDDDDADEDDDEKRPTKSARGAKPSKTSKTNKQVDMWAQVFGKGAATSSRPKTEQKQQPQATKQQTQETKQQQQVAQLKHAEQALMGNARAPLQQAQQAQHAQQALQFAKQARQAHEALQAQAQKEGKARVELNKPMSMFDAVKTAKAITEMSPQAQQVKAMADAQLKHELLLEKQHEIQRQQAQAQHQQLQSRDQHDRDAQQRYERDREKERSDRDRHSSQHDRQDRHNKNSSSAHSDRHRFDRDRHGSDRKSSSSSSSGESRGSRQGSGSGASSGSKERQGDSRSESRDGKSRDGTSRESQDRRSDGNSGSSSSGSSRGSSSRSSSGSGSGSSHRSSSHRSHGSGGSGSRSSGGKSESRS